MERLREQLATAGITSTQPRAGRPDRVQGRGHPPDQDAAFRTAANEVSTNFDRDSGVNGTYTFTMKPNVQLTLREEAVVQARQTIERRVNELGVTEPSIAQQGANGDQILVQLPGVTDVNRAKEIIRSTGSARAEDRRAGAVGVEGSAARQRPGAARAWRSCPGVGAPATRPARPSYYLVRKAAAVTGRDLRSARPSLDENNRPAVSFTLNSEGAAKFGKVTGENIGRDLAIVLDGRVQSAPRIDVAHHERRPHLRQLHAGRSAEPVADPAVRLAAGDADLSRGAHDRAEPRRRLDSLRRASRRWSAWC